MERTSRVPFASAATLAMPSGMHSRSLAALAASRRLRKRGLASSDAQFQRLDQRLVPERIQIRHEITERLRRGEDPPDRIHAALVEHRHKHLALERARRATRAAPPVIPFAGTRQATPEGKRAVLRCAPLARSRDDTRVGEDYFDCAGSLHAFDLNAKAHVGEWLLLRRLHGSVLR